MTGPANPENIEQAVIDVIAKEMKLEPERLKPEARLNEDLGAGSLNIIEIAFTLEERFGVELPAEAEGSVKTVADVTKLVTDATAKKR